MLSTGNDDKRTFELDSPFSQEQDPSNLGASNNSKEKQLALRLEQQQSDCSPFPGAVLLNRGESADDAMLPTNVRQFSSQDFDSSNYGTETQPADQRRRRARGKHEILSHFSTEDVIRDFSDDDDYDEEDCVIDSGNLQSY